MRKSDGLRLAIDIGGTFTDAVLMSPQARTLAPNKTPTSRPRSPQRRTACSHTCQGARLRYFGVFHVTTLAANALIERRGTKVARINAEGFRDTLEIAHKRRYSQYDLNIEKPDLIGSRRLAFSIAGRMNT